MANRADFYQTTGQELFIPNEFGCSNVTLWTKFGVPSYFEDLDISQFYSFLMFHNDGESYDLCSKVGNWEKNLKLSCDELLCENNDRVDNLSGYVEEITQNQTTIVDWINYCQYCSNNHTLRSYKHTLTLGRGCFPKDITVSAMINQFPSSITFCGTADFGIPILVNNTNIAADPFMTRNGYSYICYCAHDQYFSLKCANNAINLLVLQAISTGLSVIHLISCCLTFFMTFLPKYTASFREKRPFNTITITCVIIGEILLFFTTVFSQYLGSSFSMTILGNFALSLLIFSLFTWVLNWCRLIVYVKTKKATPFIIIYLVLALVFLVLYVAIPILISVLVCDDMTSVNVFFAYYNSSLTFLACAAFIALTVWIYWTMKKVSDINMLNSSCLRFVIVASISIVVFAATNLIIRITVLHSNLLAQGIFLVVYNTSTIFITCGLTIMEFDKEEFRDFYRCTTCWAKMQKTKQKHGKDESLLADNSDNLVTTNNEDSSTSHSTYYSLVKH
ncbi:hypothetical protein C9374_000296 [Naegleria lovaniensis]|uniref:Uncharacterized protein n=1 Tax=Naegleria lovaniensis TaxID=51637 RepID=A0AA88KTW6_NAELO|nr:uncharacterized protein C9374_000296 [Naegleria lovaniensis]KAG2388857.1 hypothetical protein C9374_000296 [Naegleria lovaniensis]